MNRLKLLEKALAMALDYCDELECEIYLNNHKVKSLRAEALNFDLAMILTEVKLRGENEA